MRREEMVELVYRSMEALDRARSNMLRPVDQVVFVPPPRCKRFVLSHDPMVVWPSIVRGKTLWDFFELGFDNPVVSEVCKGAGLSEESRLANIRNLHTAELIGGMMDERALNWFIRRIEEATRWCALRAEGRERHAATMREQQYDCLYELISESFIFLMRRSKKSYGAKDALSLSIRSSLSLLWKSADTLMRYLPSERAIRPKLFRIVDKVKWPDVVVESVRWDRMTVDVESIALDDPLAVDAVLYHSGKKPRIVRGAVRSMFNASKWCIERAAVFERVE